MKLESATFVYQVKGQTWHIVFMPHAVNISIDGSQLFSVDNAGRKWKPCQSHAVDLIRMHTQQPARCNQASQRVAATRPVLRVASVPSAG